MLGQLFVLMTRLLGSFYLRLRRRGKHFLVALAAVARKIITTIWHILTNDEPWRWSERKIQIPRVPSAEARRSIMRLVKAILGLDFAKGKFIS